MSKRPPYAAIGAILGLAFLAVSLLPPDFNYSAAMKSPVKPYCPTKDFHDGRLAN